MVVEACTSVPENSREGRTGNTEENRILSVELLSGLPVKLWRGSSSCSGDRGCFYITRKGEATGPERNLSDTKGAACVRGDRIKGEVAQAY